MRLTRSTAIAAVVLLVGGMSLSACSPDSGSNRALVTVNGSEPQHPLVPTATSESGGAAIVDRLFAGLIRYDINGGTHHEMAESIETTDSTNYTITIKPDWKFTDGTPVTAKSYVNAWNFGALATNAQAYASVFWRIEGFDEVSADPPTAQTMSGLKVVDDTTFTVALEEPAIDFELALGFAPFYPLPEVAYRDIKAYGENPIGNGPYKLADSDAWQHNVKIDLVPNEDYRGGRPAKNEGLSFVFYQSTDAAYSDLLADNLDVLDMIPNSALSTYKQDLGGRTIAHPTAENVYIHIPGNLAHFTGQEGVLRRRAISMAINRQQIIDTVKRGTGTSARDFTASTLPGFDSNLAGVENLEYKPDGAMRLWAQADAISPWSGKLEIAYDAGGTGRDSANAAANGIKNTLGIDAVTAAYPTFKQMQDAVTSRTIGKAFLQSWFGDYPSMLAFLEPMFSSDVESNVVDYNSPEFDRLLIAAEAAPTLQQSYQLVGQAQEVLLRDLPAIPLWYRMAVAGHSSHVTHVEIAWNGTVDYENIRKGGA